MPKFFRLLSLLAFLWGYGWANAQELDTLEAGKVPFTIIYSHEVLSAGDTALFEIHLGKEDTPFYGVHGINLSIQLLEGALLPVPSMVNYENSWLTSDEKYDASDEVDLIHRILHLRCNRTDLEPQCGYGQMVSFQVVANEDGMSPKDLVAQTVYGQVIIDNLEMKRSVEWVAASSEKNSLRLYPLPASRKVFLDAGRLEIVEVRIEDLQGRVHVRERFSGQGPYPLLISSLPRGFWLVRAIDAYGRHKILKLINEL